jgi:hypothetical protein
MINLKQVINSSMLECGSFFNRQRCMTSSGFRLSVILAAFVLLSACDEATTEVPVFPDEANSRVSITNDLNVLNDRVTYTNDDITIEGAADLPPALMLPSAAKVNNAPFSLTQVAEIQPPMVEGELVQATSVTLRNNAEGVVSYNMRGAPRLGAVDFIKRFNSSSPRLTSSVSFNDSDINAVATDGSYVYTSVATNAVGFSFPAVLERIKINVNGLTLLDNNRIPLTSFAGTSVMPVDKVIYTTSGDGGHVSAFDSKDLTLLGEYSLHDARWVTRDESTGQIVVAQGTPGALSVFEGGVFPGGTMNLLNTFPFTGANVAESKTTVDVAGSKAFIAAGPDGVQIMCLNDGQTIGSVPRPNPTELGLDPAVVVTNSVTVDGDLMFISNGEAGVYVAQGSASFNDNNCNPQSITVLGKLRFDNLQSANHVAYESGYLYVAAGLGGVKIVLVNIN